jgi:hypothetical protein
MKRLLMLVTIIGLLICTMAFSQSDVGETFIDFNELTKNKTMSDGREENVETLVYFGEQAIGSTEHLRDKMWTSLAIDNWRVTLASSSRIVERQRYCIAKEVKTKDGTSVMGIRIKFPESMFNSYAVIKPPFEIQAYQRKYKMSGGEVEMDEEGAVEDETDVEGSKFDNKGVLKNVGVVKTISVDIYGANYPHGLGVILMDQNYEEKTIHIGYLNFEDWRTLKWENPNYIEDVRNRELQKYPLYPRSVPYIKLIGFVIYRDANAWGGDFITYIKNVKITYDDAVIEGAETDIDHESTWGIIRDKNERRRKAEYRRLGERLLLEVIERQKSVETKEKTGEK